MARITALKACPIFSKLEYAEIAHLAHYAEEISIPSGEILFDDGDVSVGLLVLSKGQVEVSRPQMKGENRSILIEAPEALGALSLVRKGSLRRVKARAKKDVELVAIAVEKFQTFQKEAPLIADKVTASIFRNHLDAISLLEDVALWDDAD